MADTLFIVPFQAWVYGMVYNSAARLWLINRAFLLAGMLMELVSDWLVSQVFGSAIDEFSLLSQGLLPAFFTIAVLLLALSYLMAPFFHVRVVVWQKAVGWLLFALLFYQVGPRLYVEGEGVRRALSSEFYTLVLNQAQESGSTMGMLNSIASGPDSAMGAIDNQFGPFVPTDQYVDGLDLAMSYTLSTGNDVVYADNPLPLDFEAEYFDPATGPLFFLSMTEMERTDSVNAALSGISRLLLSLIIVFFGLFEQAIYLSLVVAAGVLFISMSVAILFAFFERTEMMARTLVDMWLELFILSVIIAVLQAMIVGVVTLGARTLNPTLTLGSSLLGGLAMLVLLFKALGAVWESMNRLFAAMSQTVGGGVMSPAEAGLAGASAAAGAGLTIATAGAGAAVAAAAGGSLAQVAGSALSGMDSMYNAAAMGSLVLPEESQLRGAATGFYEGALSNRLLGPAGGLILHGRSTEGTPPETDPTAGAPLTEKTMTAQAETEVRFDAADIASLRDAVVSAIQQAANTAPAGGYKSSDAAMQAVREELGSAASDPEMSAYLAKRTPDIAHQVMVSERQQASTHRISAAAESRFGLGVQETAIPTDDEDSSSDQQPPIRRRQQ